VESIVLVQPPGGETLALRIFNLLHYGYAAQVNALCLVLLGLALLPLVVCGVSLWAREKNSKLQTPSSGESSSSNLQTTSARSGLGVRNLVHLWMLALGAWCFCAGCSPADAKHGARLNSQFFERAEVIGTRGVGIGEFNKPRSVTVDRAGDLYCVDITGRVQKFSPDGEFILSWQMQDIERGRPKGMCCDAEGNIVVGEPHYQRVNHFTPAGKLVLQWGIAGTNAGELTFPRSEAVNSRGELLLSEYTTVERVQKFRVPSESVTQDKPLTPALSPSEGERENRPPSRVGSVSPSILMSFGQPGTGEGEFNRAEGICVDAQDRIYVADSCNHRVQIFSPDGKFIRQYGRAGSGLGEFSYPYDIKVDARGYQFVCEFGNSRIQVFDADCNPVEIIGGPGAEAGRFANPWSVTLDSHGNLFVADSQNHRVQKLVRRLGQTGLLRPRGTGDTR
jgi:sugar lactone lactonase YvrE